MIFLISEFTNLTRPNVKFCLLSSGPHLLVAEGSRGPERRRGSQTAQAPRLGSLWRFQGPPVDGGMWRAMVGGVGQRVVGRRQWHRLAVRMLAGWSDRMRGELLRKKRKNRTFTVKETLILLILKNTLK